MKHLIFAALALCATLTAQAAERRTVNADELNAFFKSTTYVVTTNDNIILDALLGDAAKRLWTATPHKVVSKAEFDQLKLDEKNSFLMITRVVEAKDKLKRPYLYLTLVMGSKDADKDLNLMPEVAFIPMTTETPDGETASTVMLDPMVLFVQKHAENAKDKSFASRLLANFQQRLQAYNYNMGQLKGKTIYVNKSDVDSQSEMAQAEASGMFRFVDEDAIAGVVKAREANAAVAFCVAPQGSEKGAYGYKMVMGVDGALCYYYYETKHKNFLFKKNDFDMLLQNAK
jgi:hypothetical protein